MKLTNDGVRFPFLFLDCIIALPFCATSCDVNRSGTAVPDSGVEKAGHWRATKTQFEAVIARCLSIPSHRLDFLSTNLQISLPFPEIPANARRRHMLILKHGMRPELTMRRIFTGSWDPGKTKYMNIHNVAIALHRFSLRVEDTYSVISARHQIPSILSSFVVASHRAFKLQSWVTSIPPSFMPWRYNHGLYTVLECS
jgi:hypothetical protein